MDDRCQRRRGTGPDLDRRGVDGGGAAADRGGRRRRAHDRQHLEPRPRRRGRHACGSAGSRRRAASQRALDAVHAGEPESTSDRAATTTRPSGPAKLWVAWADAHRGRRAGSADTDGANGVAPAMPDAPAFDVAPGSALRVAAATVGCPQPTSRSPRPSGHRDGGRRSESLDPGLVRRGIEPADVPLPRRRVDCSSTDVLIVAPPGRGGAACSAARPPVVRRSAGLSTSLEQSLHADLHAARRSAVSGMADASHFVELIGGRRGSCGSTLRGSCTGRPRVRDRRRDRQRAQTFRFLRRLTRADGRGRRRRRRAGCWSSRPPDRAPGPRSRWSSDHVVHRSPPSTTTTDRPWIATLVPPLAGVAAGDRRHLHAGRRAGAAARSPRPTCRRWCT